MVDMIKAFTMKNTEKKYALENYTQVVEYWKQPFWKRWFKSPPIKELTCIGHKPTHYRRAGNTTRRVNEIIEEIFSGEEARVLDHYTTSKSNKMLLDIVLRRLLAEHGIEKGSVLIRRRTNPLYKCVQFHIKLKN